MTPPGTDLTRRLWELYERYVQPIGSVTAVLDDRARVVAMWRALGLTVLQVAEGNF